MFQLDNGLLSFTCFERTEHDRKDAIANIRAARKTLGTESAALLLDLRGLKRVTKGAQKIYNLPDFNKNIFAVAIIAEKCEEQLSGLFLFEKETETVPVHLFSDVAEARAWLESFLVDMKLAA